ncbi:MAG: hypothetical protein MET45_04755 [Nostoc sp. LLA-1]|nr:hypothetical protein [Cyanocohniella sp. LLY]
MAGIGRFSAESFHTNCLPLLNLPAEILSGEGQIELTKAIVIARRLGAASESSAVPDREAGGERI